MSNWAGAGPFGSAVGIAGRIPGEVSLLTGRTVILFLGRLHAKKGLDLLIPAFDIVHRRQPERQLLLVGPGDAGDVGSIRAEIAKRKMESCITLTGPLYGRDKWAAQAASDLFVLPSYQENFAISVVECAS